MRPPAGLAQRYLDEGTALREALDMPRRARIEAIPIGQGEHNANFRFVHPVTKKAYVLRINFASPVSYTHLMRAAPTNSQERPPWARRAQATSPVR